jgi:SMC interacting uncharacterized protein involved in chromosome segregation
MGKLTDVEGIKNRHLQHCSAGMFTNRSDWERVARQMHYDTGMLLEHIRRQDKLLAEKDKQIVEWQSDSVNLRGAIKAKDKLIAEQEKALAICEGEYRKADKLLAEKDKQIVEWQSDSVNVRGAMKAKDKQIAELVDVLEKMLYTNCTMEIYATYREKVDALVDRYRKGD